MSLKIATWNLDQPNSRGWKKRQALIIQKIKSIDADVWILTETDNHVIDLSDTYHCMSSKPYSDGFTSTTIWFRLTIPYIEEISTLDDELSACIALDLSFFSLIVYGTIIPYHAYRGRDGISKNWEEHYKAIEACSTELTSISRRYPNYKLCVAGDFNQSRDGSRWYGTKRGRESLTQQLNHNNLICVTEEDMVANNKLKTRHNIDHICFSKDWFRKVQIMAWEGMTEDGIYLSDHNGVCACLSF